MKATRKDLEQFKDDCPICGIRVKKDPVLKETDTGVHRYHAECINRDKEEKDRKSWLWHPGDGPMPI